MKNKSGLKNFILFIICIAAFIVIIASEQSTTAPAPTVTAPVIPTTDTQTSDTFTPTLLEPQTETADTTDTLDSLNTYGSQPSTDTSTSDTTTTDQVNTQATAQCNDGTYSYDTNQTTACSNDGGVENALQ